MLFNDVLLMTNGFCVSHSYGPFSISIEMLFTELVDLYNEIYYTYQFKIMKLKNKITGNSLCCTLGGGVNLGLE